MVGASEAANTLVWSCDTQGTVRELSLEPRGLRGCRWVKQPDGSWAKQPRRAYAYRWREWQKW